LSSSCEINIVPSQQLLNPWQKTALNWIANLQSGRDVVIAVDLTESVGFNEGTKIRLRQIVEDSLKQGDSVYVVPFAATVNPLQDRTDSLTLDNAIVFTGKATDIEKIIEAIPTQSNTILKNTDIQRAELYIYQGLAQINQCRLSQNLPIKSQSVVWITDAPLLTQPGINSETWIETPSDSPFRLKESPESQNRQKWLEVLPLQSKSLDLESYQLTIIDIPPTVQEFCTPAPGGKQTCLVNPYLFKQLWLPVSLLFIFSLGSLIGLGVGLNYWRLIRKKWRLIIDFESGNQEEQICYLANNQKIAIGLEGINSINCPGSEIRGYLERRGTQLFLIPTGLEPLEYRGTELTKSEKVSYNYFTLNCPTNNQDFEITIKLSK
jgi:hypothetical protein